MELTPREKSVYDFICRFRRRTGMAPTVREIGKHLGLKGPAGVHRVLNILIEKGYLESTAGKKRSWRPVNAVDGPRLPLVGKIAAGMPLGVFEESDEHLPVDPLLYGHEGCFAVRVTGDTMIGAHIRDGDIAVIRPANRVANGAIAAVLVDAILPEATLKTFRRKKNTVELISENPDYPPLVFKGEEREKITVLGIYVGMLRVLRSRK